ncbi:MAG: 4-hydroxy-tetrahydrodipicolinate reductase [Candidatus Heimdallarchaeota archaeon]|nr:4-hydroxy-tetrahydrodipicolinate reductase [Candidatus Heimdallarchaeota archaeon]
MRIGLIGGSGKMGHAIDEVVEETSHKIVATFDIDKPLSSETILDCEVLIDFSIASVLEANLDIALQKSVPFVTGTTGWYDQIKSFKDKVDKANGSFLYASNFSIGILLFHKLLARTAELYSPFSQYDFAIHEIHHNKKADSPSGTALTLAGEVLKNLPGKTDLQISNPPAKIAPDKLQVSSSRVGSVPGTHTLYVESPQDSVEVIHRARGRAGFASGAIKAAEWIISRKGFYSMDDMIKTLVK